MTGLGSREQQLIDKFRAACDILAKRADGIVLTDDADRRVKQLYLFYFAKGVRTFYAFCNLCEAGFTTEAQILTRANFELVIDLLYFHNSPNERSRQLEDWLHATEWQAEHFGIETETNEAQLSAAREAFSKKYGFDKFPNKHWSGIRTIKERAETVGLQVTYATTYRFHSDLAHSGTYALATYLDCSSGDACFTIEPDWSDAKMVVSGACIEMLYCLQAIEEGLGLASYDLVHELHLLLHGNG